MISLSDQTPFAEGDNRLCYVSPVDATQCLKVIKPDKLTQRFTSAKWYKRLRGKQAMDDNLQEARAYHQSAIRFGGERVWQHLPRWYGQVETDLGRANVTELIGDQPGQPGHTLEHLLRTRGLDSEISEALSNLSDWLVRTGVLTRNLLPHNLVAKQTPTGIVLYLIDGLGAPLMARTLSLQPGLRRRYTRRRIRRMWLRAHWEAGGRYGQWEDIERDDR